MRIEHQQPRLVPPPVAEVDERLSTRGREWVQRSRSFASRASSRGSLAVRRKMTGYQDQQRRPLKIGAPSDFRHVENGLPRRIGGGFRPLELSIYMPDNQLSPLLPHFADVDKELPFPPPVAYSHSRTDSSSTFTIARKPIGSSSRASSEWTANFKPGHGSLNAQELLAALEAEVPRAPPAARMRAMTAPPAYERVKSALHEKLDLEQRLRDIDELIDERQSIYLSSRPTSRATSTRRSSIYVETYGMPPDLLFNNLLLTIPEPMPPAKPSFMERVASSEGQRPGTASSRILTIPSVLKPVHEETTPVPSPRMDSFIPPPPLPLVLQAPAHPPLRKKKSFARVSHWLFPTPTTDQHPPRNTSLESVTNTPKPITSRDGFYQCVELRQHFQTQQQHHPDRSSFASATTVSSSSTKSELDDPRAPTTATAGTPASSPDGCGRDMDDGAAIRSLSFDYSERADESIELTRIRTFGERDLDPEKEPWRIESIPGVNVRESRVGMAF